MSHNITRAQLLMEHRRFSAAVELLVLELGANPNNADALALLAICRSEMNDNKEALAHIRHAIAIEPFNAHHFYIHALISLRMKDVKEAAQHIREAIGINPWSADYFEILSAIELENKNWEKALEAANQGLAIAADHTGCLNRRTTALIKLKRPEEAYDTINDALEEDPEDANTHANTGWAFLERGEHKKALKHFSEALRLQPGNEWARQGLVEALKARFLVYRWFLSYLFWISNLKPAVQTGLIVGMYLLVRVLGNISAKNPAIEPFVTPILVVYGLFALSTWIAYPLFNLLLRLNRFGRHALDKRQTVGANLLGSTLGLAIVSLTAWLVSGIDAWTTPALVFLLLAVPFGTMLMPANPSRRRFAVLAGAGLAGLGLVCIALAFAGHASAEQTLNIFFILTVVYQFAFNFYFAQD